MPLETATYITDLVTANPASSDGLNQADDHMRLIKSTLKNTFPNFTSAALSSTQAQLDAIAALLVNGVLRANGSCPAGFIADFARTTPPAGWLECNGAAVSRTTYPDLFAAINTTWGAGDGSTTFNLPPDRFRRGKNAAGVAVGTLQADQNKAHTHTGSGTTAVQNANHAHNFAGTTGFSNQSLNHSHSYTRRGGILHQDGNIAATVATQDVGDQTGAVDLTGHTHNFSGTTSGITADHGHAFSFTSDGGSADGTEARPLSMSVLTCIKT